MTSCARSAAGWRRQRQRGATMIEFAAILLPLLILFYGVIVYSLVFVTQQAVAFAADRGAAAAVVVNPAMAAPQFKVQARGLAQQRVDDLLQFLPGTASVAAVKAQPLASGSARRVTVKVEYPFANWRLPVPTFLPMPDVIRAVGVANVSFTGT